MATYDRNPYARPTVGAAPVDVGIDQGLRSYMLRVYNYMAIGLVVTGVAALAVFNLAVTTNAADAVAQVGNGMYLTQFGVTMYTSPLKWVFMLAPLGFIFFLGARIGKMSLPAAQMTFWAFAAVMGISLSSILMVYTSESIGRVFFITAAAFGALSLYGYTTKKDLSGWGSFLFMGLIGIIIASLVNLFLASSALQFAVSVIGVLVFAGLTAYDTQRIKEMYYVGDDGSVAGRKAVMGALSLYLNFINMFMMLLSLFGNRN
ncbi:Bax inhibitor-1/YccA family protein [Acuticoccus kandeliae]|uniref:Bax inhibitor-1/YccA family protein n=1 Tax=Acuticoccus kandeliae TaxID=2073160 RepID=UPI000D3EBD16|nr:Bax inhibitor-1/YccA family protein [Acuticoccus kandeliae]